MATKSPTSTIPLDDDIINPKFAASALDFLLIELVPLAQRLTEQLLTRDKVLLDEYKRNRIFHRPVQATPIAAKATAPTPSGTTLTSTLQDPMRESGVSSEMAVPSTSMRDSTVPSVGPETEDAGTVTTSLGYPVVNDETREGMVFRLDGLGYRVGQGLVERFSLSRPRPTSPLEAIKFLCKDLWPLLFGRKQIDNLKTNHRGTFVLTDTRFHPLARMSVDRRAGNKAVDEAIQRAQLHLYFPCGVIRGALSGLGVEASVEASSVEMPTAMFQIKMVGATG